MTHRTERLAPLTGLAAIALVAVSALLTDFYEYLPDPGDIQAHLTDNATRLQWAGYIGIVAAALLLWFGSSLRSTLRAAEGGDGRISNIAFGGAVAAGGLLLVSYSIAIAAAGRAGSEGGITADAAATTYDIYSSLVGGGASAALGVMIAAFAVIAFRTRVMPRWAAWVSAIIGVGAISPLSYIFIGLAALWVAYMSLALYLAGRRTVGTKAL